MTATGSLESCLAPSFLPTTAVLEMTYRCNHTCLFCSCPWENPDGRFARGVEMTATAWKETIAQLCTMGVTNLAFTGGEPLLRDDLLDIMAFAAGCETEHIETLDEKLVRRRAPPQLFLLSNGRLLDEAVLDFCHRHNIQLSLSLPGLENFTRLTGGFDPDHVLEQFARARRKQVKTVVGITVTKWNLPELYETISAAFLAGADQLLLNRFLPGGRGLAHAAELALTMDETRQMALIAEEALTDAGRYGSIGTELPKCLLQPAQFQRLTIGTRCAAAQSFFAISPAGFVRVCNHSPVQLNHVRDIAAVKTHPYWKKFALKDYLPAPCAGCRECGDCDAGCREAAHITAGAPDALEPGLTVQPFAG